jgi:hypothetical protein
MDCRDLESLGADRVRLRIQARLWPPEYMELALDWLALKDAEAARQAEADRATTARVANTQNTRDNIAAIAAIIAAITGVLSGAVALLDWLKVRP